MIVHVVGTSVINSDCQHCGKYVQIRTISCSVPTKDRFMHFRKQPNFFRREGDRDVSGDPTMCRAVVVLAQ